MKLASFDVETRGTQHGYALQPFRARTNEAWVTMLAVASDTGVEGCRFPEADHVVRKVRFVSYIGRFLRACARDCVTIVCWNAPFDIAWCIAAGLRDEVYACKWLDGMLLWKHLTASPEWTGLAPKSYGLKACVAEHLPQFAGYEKDIDFETDDPQQLDALYEYNKLDATYTLMLTQGFLNRLSPAQKRNVLIEAACLPMIAESIVAGVTINRQAAEALSKKLEADANIAFVKLLMNTSEEITPETLASPKKLQDLLYDKWRLVPPKYTEKGAASTDRDALSTLAETDPRASLLNDYREAKNNRTKFAEGVLKSEEYNGDGCARPLAKAFGTYTGRMTYSGSTLKTLATGFPLHQFKRDAEFRRTISVPEGYTLLEFDFSGQEFRWMAVMSGDQTMLSMCAPGEDAHAYMGSRIGNRDYHRFKELYELADTEVLNLRQLGKVGNLSCQYRTSANTLMRVARVMFNLTLSPMEAKAIHGTYRTTYPEVPKYWKNQIDKARMCGFVETVAGRQVQLGKGNTWDGNKWSLESTAINYPIQGSGADQKYLALLILRDYLNKVNGRFYFEMHDAAEVVVPTPKAEKAAHEIKDLLSNLPYKKAWGIDLPIQFPVDAKMGKSWGDLVKVK